LRRVVVYDNQPREAGRASKTCCDDDEEDDYTQESDAQEAHAQVEDNGCVCDDPQQSGPDHDRCTRDPGADDDADPGEHAAARDNTKHKLVFTTHQNDSSHEQGLSTVLRLLAPSPAEARAQPYPRF
jgi:hypothetical protein